MSKILKYLICIGSLLSILPLHADIDRFYDSPYATIDPYYYNFEDYPDDFPDHWYSLCPYCSNYYQPYYCQHGYYYSYEQREGRIIHFRGGFDGDGSKRCRYCY